MIENSISTDELDLVSTEVRKGERNSLEIVAIVEIR